MALLVVGVIAFMYALREENEIARWVGIACVAVALLLRFVRKPAA
jgi:hypothetical protein